MLHHPTPTPATAAAAAETTAASAHCTVAVQDVAAPAGPLLKLLLRVLHVLQADFTTADATPTVVVGVGTVAAALAAAAAAAVFLGASIDSTADRTKAVPGLDASPLPIPSQCPLMSALL